MCQKHWRRWKLYGDPNFTKLIRGDDTARFASKYTVDDNGCWLWTGRIDKDGYDKFRTPQAWRFAHRVGYAMHVGSIPTGLHLDHLCRVRNCVNPAHLETVTPRENTLRGEPANRTHCPRGHEYTPQNTSGTGRTCVTCNRARNRRRRERRRDAAVTQAD
ncbi:HNH endonuclease signature motif containing protein [Saccharopolyspora soli]|uniref:HNH endonuclease signature motif containing protein n=1 Tax=Saccharopolyspora soli TaxID=2926618 RepID=UPI003558A644